MNNSELFGKNLKFLRKLKGLNQDGMKSGTGIERATWSDYERGNTEPDLKGLISISTFFEVSIDDLLSKNLEFEKENVHLIKNSVVSKTDQNVHLNVHPNVHLNAKKEGNNREYKLSIITEKGGKDDAKMVYVPITDISVAAGAGIFNNEHVETVSHFSLPTQMAKKQGMYISIRVKGASMAPTIQDGDYVVIRLLDKSEWAEMPDKQVYVVCDMDGKGYLKRVKNRFNRDFLVLTSDSPDKISFPNFNLYTNEIHHIWMAVAKMSFKMANIHDQYYAKLDLMEERLDELANDVLKIKGQSK